MFGSSETHTFVITWICAVLATFWLNYDNLSCSLVGPWFHYCNLTVFTKTTAQTEKKIGFHTCFVSPIIETIVQYADYMTPGIICAFVVGWASMVNFAPLGNTMCYTANTVDDIKGSWLMHAYEALQMIAQNNYPLYYWATIKELGSQHGWSVES